MKRLFLVPCALVALVACSKETPPAPTDTATASADADAAVAADTDATANVETATGSETATSAETVAETTPADTTTVQPAIACVEQPTDLPLPPSATVQLPCDLLPPGLK